MDHINPSNQEIIKLIQGGFNRLEEQNLEIKAQNLEIKSQNLEIRNQYLETRRENEELKQIILKTQEEQQIFQQIVVAKLQNIENQVILLNERVIHVSLNNTPIEEHQELEVAFTEAATDPEYHEETKALIGKSNSGIILTPKVLNKRTHMRALHNTFNLENKILENLTKGQKCSFGNWLGKVMTNFHQVIGLPPSTFLGGNYSLKADDIFSLLSKQYIRNINSTIRMY